jgi:hypothetical protein
MEIHAGIFCGNLKKRDNLEYLLSRWKDNIKIDVKE